MFKVGRDSEVEVSELEESIDDALCSTRAASDEGIVRGGGVRLLYAFVNLDKVKGEKFD